MPGTRCDGKATEDKLAVLMGLENAMVELRRGTLRMLAISPLIL
jgi:hypothetical protein